jgi:hypothetical protein
MLSREREIGFVLRKNVFGRYSMLDIGCSMCDVGVVISLTPSIPLSHG